MSVVGPRPALPSEVEQWTDDVHDRLRVLPGITGMWQVSGRSDTTFDEYKRLDLYYVDNWSLAHDAADRLQDVRGRARPARRPLTHDRHARRVAATRRDDVAACRPTDGDRARMAGASGSPSASADGRGAGRRISTTCRWIRGSVDMYDDTTTVRRAAVRSGARWRSASGWSPSPLVGWFVVKAVTGSDDGGRWRSAPPRSSERPSTSTVAGGDDAPPHDRTTDGDDGRRRRRRTSVGRHAGGAAHDRGDDGRPRRPPRRRPRRRRPRRRRPRPPTPPRRAVRDAAGRQPGAGHRHLRHRHRSRSTAPCPTRPPRQRLQDLAVANAKPGQAATRQQPDDQPGRAAQRRRAGRRADVGPLPGGQRRGPARARPPSSTGSSTS